LGEPGFLGLSGCSDPAGVVAFVYQFPVVPRDGFPYVGAMIKPGEFYHCRIVGGGHGEGEYLAEIVPGPEERTEFADVGMPKTYIRVDPPPSWFDPDVFFYCIAADFTDYQSILLRSTAESFEKSIIRKITSEELPLFIGWHCTKRYQDFLQSIL
jgi:hypothetical protein